MRVTSKAIGVRDLLLKPAQIGSPAAARHRQPALGRRPVRGALGAARGRPHRWPRALRQRLHDGTARRDRHRAARGGGRAAARRRLRRRWHDLGDGRRHPRGGRGRPRPSSASSRAARAATSGARSSCPKDLAEAARRARDGAARVIDAGRVHYVAHDGSAATRHFVNVASFGFSSAVAGRANASSKRLGGKMAFLGATVGALAVLRQHRRVAHARRRRATAAPRAHGRRRQRPLLRRRHEDLPAAQLDSGTLDVVVVGDFTRLDVLTKVGRLYDGTHLDLESVTAATARKLVASPVEADALVPIELDGETQRAPPPPLNSSLPRRG